MQLHLDRPESGGVRAMTRWSRIRRPIGPGKGILETGKPIPKARVTGRQGAAIFTCFLEPVVFLHYFFQK